MFKKKKPQRKVVIKPLNEKCPFCVGKKSPSYKEYKVLLGYISERARILPRERSGVCSKHQRSLAKEVKRARFLGLVPYAPGTVA